MLIIKINLKFLDFSFQGKNLSVLYKHIIKPSMNYTVKSKNIATILIALSAMSVASVLNAQSASTGSGSGSGSPSTGPTSIGEETARATAAEDDLDSKITAEKSRATTAEGVLTTNLNKEVSDRIAAVTAEAATREAADTTEANRAIAAEGVLTTNLTKEVADRIEAVDTEKNRALAAESVLSDRATALEGRAHRAEGRINSLRKGVAMAAALQTPVIEAGKQNAVKAGVATVDGAQGFGIAVAHRVNESVQVNLDVATDFETDTAARAGVNYSF